MAIHVKPRAVRALASVTTIFAFAVVAPYASAQTKIRPSNATLSIPHVGSVLSQTGVVAGDRTNGGDMYASTTARTTNNGPYALQAKLVVPFTDKGKPAIVNTVLALSPPGTSYVALSTTTWVTVAIGPASINANNNIQLLVQWGKSSSKDPKQIPDIQLVYQVIGR